MDITSIAVVCGALAGGTVGGLGGFGLALVSMPIWLLVLAPDVATPLVVICSVLAQLPLLPGVRHALGPRRLVPLIAGGLVGTPVGTLLLPHVPGPAFRAVFGVVLVTVCVILLFTRDDGPRIADQGPIAEGLVGGLGGLLGGLSGASGPAPIIWARLRGWSKEESRATFIAFNLSILAMSLAWQAAGGLVTADVSRLVLLALPATWIGTRIGVHFYGRLNPRRFNQFVLLVLCFAGIGMVIGAGSALLP